MGRCLMGILVCIPTLLSSQTVKDTGLTVSVATVDMNAHQASVVVTNGTSRVVTAYALAIKGPLQTGSPNTWARLTVDLWPALADGSSQTDPLLGPGDARTQRVPFQGGVVPEILVLAVVFDDRSSAGDAGAVSEIAEDRAGRYEGIQQILAELQRQRQATPGDARRVLVRTASALEALAGESGPPKSSRDRSRINALRGHARLIAHNDRTLVGANATAALDGQVKLLNAYAAVLRVHSLIRTPA